ncbi:aminoglycoside phosphotransferase family protein [Paenibacillus albidus]|uniref:aminoglycoside phosphotransferase family protein n=1 Tax=Paenibacillus albidus TaxID=2041023 RepID=UPI001BEC8103|nr:aminoglycoside phosphotransferase family protein [Paenibacillus albidus]MBT2291025.1 aminoglycoside phosphotransferase family protein [Paenibacillus albidus]
MQLTQLTSLEIPCLQGATEIIEIQKGYSTDRKFRVQLENGKVLVRSFDMAQVEVKRREFEVLKAMEQYNVLCSRPLEFGQMMELGWGYMVLSYVEGEDAVDQLPHYPVEQQYAIGFQAGQELAKIHQYQAPEGTVSSWYDRKLPKHKRYVEQYNRLGIRFKGDAEVLSFIDEHLELMRDRPNLFQHDDYHVGNLIVSGGKLAGVIDFNRYDWGDPVHEFLKVGMFSTETSIPFCIGQILGYHQKQDPDESFWKLYSLYIAMCLISSVVWIQKVKPEETDLMLATIHRVLEDHDGFERMMPKWYTAGNIGL